jgi:hypothetical protein
MENIEPIKQILNELFSLLETLETQNGALLAYLKDRKLVNDKKLAPFLDQAGNAASVRWRAARARMEHLLAPPPKKSTEEKIQSTQPQEKSGEAPEKPGEVETGANGSKAKSGEPVRQPSRVGAIPASPESSDAKTKEKTQGKPQDKLQAKSQNSKPEQKQKAGETPRQPDKK